MRRLVCSKIDFVRDYVIYLVVCLRTDLNQIRLSTVLCLLGIYLEISLCIDRIRCSHFASNIELRCTCLKVGQDLLSVLISKVSSHFAMSYLTRVSLFLIVWKKFILITPIWYTGIYILPHMIMTPNLLLNISWIQLIINLLWNGHTEEKNTQLNGSSKYKGR